MKKLLLTFFVFSGISADVLEDARNPNSVFFKNYSGNKLEYSDIASRLYAFRTTFAELIGVAKCKFGPENIEQLMLYTCVELLEKIGTNTALDLKKDLICEYYHKYIESKMRFYASQAL